MKIFECWCLFNPVTLLYYSPKLSIRKLVHAPTHLEKTIALTFIFPEEKIMNEVIKWIQL